jgi:acyl-CoA reductase-like NAD-dependent aldehyde dehydrogenase
MVDYVHHTHSLFKVDAFSKTFPPGTIHFISGSGRTTMPPLMRSGFIDGLGFIGGSKAADELIRQHPEPHRLKLFLQLEAKNMGVSSQFFLQALHLFFSVDLTSLNFLS